VRLKKWMVIAVIVIVFGLVFALYWMFSYLDHRKGIQLFRTAWSTGRWRESVPYLCRSLERPRFIVSPVERQYAAWALA
jgi:hypothetical protein